MVEVRTANQLEDLRELLTLGGDVSIAVAYLTKSGLDQIEKQLQGAIEKGRPVKMVIDLHCGITEPDTLEKLVKLSRDSGNSFEFKAFFGVNPMFHAKLYISRCGESVSFLSGSFNLTGKAIDGNLEHGLYVRGEIADKVCKKALDGFDEFWKKAVSPSDDQVERYRTSYIASREKLSNPEALAELLNHSEVNYWLLKCNPDKPYTTDPEERFYDYDRLLKDHITEWGEIIKNATVHKYMREMKKGEWVLFYHSGEKQKKVVGKAQVEQEAYDDPKRPLVKIKAERSWKFANEVSLQEIKDGNLHPSLADLGLRMSKTQKQVSVLKVNREEYCEIVELGTRERQP